MKHVVKRGVLNGLLLSFWVLAFTAAPRVGYWIYWELHPLVVNFNMH